MERRSFALGKILSSTCFIYTVVSVIILLFGVTFTDVPDPAGLNAWRFILLLPFSLALALLNFMKRESTLSKPAKFFIHFIGTAISFYVFLCLPVRKDSSPAGTFMIIWAICLGYLCVYAISFIFSSRKKNMNKHSLSSQNNESYTKNR